MIPCAVDGRADARIDKLREEEELGKEAKREYKRQKKADADAKAQEVRCPAAEQPVCLLAGTIWFTCAGPPARDGPVLTVACAQGIDPEMAAMMGFGGFGSKKK